MAICEYCNNNFRDGRSLKRHQETAQYCILLQHPDIEEDKLYYCHSKKCGRSFPLEYNLNRHEKTCKLLIESYKTDMNGKLLKYKRKFKKYKKIIHEKDLLYENSKRKIEKLKRKIDDQNEKIEKLNTYHNDILKSMATTNPCITNALTNTNSNNITIKQKLVGKLAI